VLCKFKENLILKLTELLFMVREDINCSVAMTFTTNTNSTLRRHCEAKEKIPGDRKIHLPKQSHPQPSSVVNGTQNTSGN